MGLFSSLFNKLQETSDKNADIKKLTKTPEDLLKEQAESRLNKDAEGVPDSNGLMPEESAMIILSQNYNKGSRIPDITCNDYAIWYRIHNPNKIIEKLYNEGYIEPQSKRQAMEEMYMTLKLAELKKKAAEKGLSDKGKKAVLAHAIVETMSEAEIDKAISTQKWIPTEKGKKALQERPYIEYMVTKQGRKLGNYGITINLISKIQNEHPKMKYRDIIWGQTNKSLIEVFKNIQKTGNYSDYIDLTQLQAEFLLEEGRDAEALERYSVSAFYTFNYYMQDELAYMSYVTAQIKKLFLKLDIMGEERWKYLLNKFERYETRGTYTKEDTAGCILLIMDDEWDKSKSALKKSKRIK